MKRTVFLACLCAAFACLALGYAIALPWYAQAAPLACALAWLFAGSSQPSPCLYFSILVAALGIILKAPAAPMILGTSAFLALWDFARASIGAGGREADRKELASYKRDRLPFLLLALGVGAGAAILGSRASIGMPFYAMLALGIACLVGLDRLFSALRKGD